MRLLEWLGVGLGGLVLVALGVSSWALQTGRAAKLVEGQLERTLKEACGLDARFESLVIEPMAASLRLYGLVVRGPEGDLLLSVGDALASIRILPLLRGRVELEEVRLAHPRVRLQVAGGRLASLPRCLEGARTREGASSGPPPLGIDSAHVMNGVVEVALEDRGHLEVGGLFLEATPGRSGGTDVAFGWEGGRIQVRDRALRLFGTRLSARLEGSPVSPRSVQVERLQTEVEGLALDVVGSVDLLGPVYEAEVRASAELGTLAPLVPGLPETSGHLSVDLRVEGATSRPEVRGTLEVTEGRIGVRHLGQRVRVALAADRAGVDLEEVVVELGEGKLRAGARIDFDERFSIRAQATTERLSFAALMDALGERGIWVDFVASGPTRVQGTLAPLRLEGPLDFSLEGVDVWEGSWDDPRVTARPDARMLDVVPTRVTGRWAFSDTSIDIRDALIVGERSRGRASARIRHQHPGAVTVDADFERLALVDLGGVGAVPLEGTGPVSLRLEGRFDRLSARGTIDLEGISVGGTPLGRAASEVRWDGAKTVRLAAIEGRLGRTRWHGDVQIIFQGEVPVSVTGEIARGQLGDLLLPLGFGAASAAALEGNVRGRFSLTGPVRRWTGPVRLEAEDVRVGGERFGNGSAEGRLVDGRVIVERATLEKREATLSAKGFFDPGLATFALEASSRGLRLSSLDVLREALPRLDGRAEARVDLRGRLERPEGTLEVILAEIRAGAKAGGDEGRPAAGETIKAGKGRLLLRLDGERGTLEARLGGLGLSADAVVDLEPRLPYRGTIRLERSPAPLFVGALLGADVEGLTSIGASLSGRLLEPTRASGVIRIDQLRSTASGLVLDVRTPVDLELREGVLAFRDVRIGGGDLTATLSGRAGRDIVDIELDGRLDLQRLAGWVDPVERSAGRFDFSGKLQRSAAGLDLVGAGRIEGGALEWRGVSNRFSGIRGELTFSQSSVLVEGLTARWAGGAVQAGGSLLLEDLRPSALAFEARLKGARPRIPLPWMDIGGRLDGAIELSGTWPKLVARGALEVREARATPRTDLSELVGSRRLAAAYDPSAEVLDVDVGLDLIDPFRVKNDDVDVALRGDLRLTGTNERIGLLGSLALDQGGRVSFVGREYVTEAGVIELKERYRVATRYDLSVSTSACDARIYLSLVGDLEAVATSYTSNPEMDRDDIVSCLVRGIRRRDLDQDLASFAGSALLKLSGVDRQVKRVIPVDQIEVTTEFSSRARAYEPRVLVAKDISLLERPLRLEYSTSLLRNDDQRAAFRVRLTPRLSLQLGWTSSEDVPTGDWGLDLQRRWEW